MKVKKAEESAAVSSSSGTGSGGKNKNRKKADDGLSSGSAKGEHISPSPYACAAASPNAVSSSSSSKKSGSSSSNKSGREKENTSASASSSSSTDKGDKPFSSSKKEKSEFLKSAEIFQANYSASPRFDYTRVIPTPPCNPRYTEKPPPSSEKRKPSIRDLSEDGFGTGKKGLRMR